MLPLPNFTGPFKDFFNLLSFGMSSWPPLYFLTIITAFTLVAMCLGERTISSRGFATQDHSRTYHVWHHALSLLEIRRDHQQDTLCHCI